MTGLFSRVDNKTRLRTHFFFACRCNNYWWEAKQWNYFNCANNMYIHLIWFMAKNLSSIISNHCKDKIFHYLLEKKNLRVWVKFSCAHRTIFDTNFFFLGYILRNLWFIMITNKSAENGQKMAWLTPPTFVCLSIEVEKASRPSSFLSFFCISTVRILLWWFLLFEYNSNSLPCSSAISIAKPKSFFSNCFNKRIAIHYFLSKM